MVSTESALGVSEIARALDINKVSVHRILKSLENIGWVSQDETTRKFRLGRHIYQFSLLTASRMPIQKISLPYLYTLSHMSGESAQLSLRIGTHRIFAQDISGNKESRLRVHLGLRLPLWAGATGRCMLAFLSDSDIDQIITLMNEGHTEPDNPRLIPKQELQSNLEKIRRDGFAVSSAELQPDICAISAPIIDKTKLVVGAISIRGLLPRFGLEHAKIYSSAVIDAAKNIGQTLSEAQ